MMYVNLCIIKKHLQGLLNKNGDIFASKLA